MIDGSVVPTPAIGDINGDGEIDIVVASGNSHEVFAFRWDGVPIAGDWPKRLDEQYQPIASPVLGDVDGDGDIEVAIGTRGGVVYLWDEAGAFNGDRIEWPMFRHDLHQTGWYESGGEHCVPADIDGDGDVDLDDWVAFLDCMDDKCTNTCLTGPATDVPEACRASDLDCDDAVDLRDVALFQDVFVASCEYDTDCDDATFCNGAETCADGVCSGGSPPCSDSEVCDEVSDICVCPCEPDLNGDGHVDLFDANILAACMGTAPADCCPRCDMDCDGDIDEIDLGLWQSGC
jgi:hypothetical protein